jgi:hypothetical protein
MGVDRAKLRHIMQYNLNTDVAIWLDAVRGKLSRQQYITIVLRQQMQQQSTITTQDIYDQTNIRNGAIDALSQN